MRSLVPRLAFGARFDLGTLLQFGEDEGLPLFAAADFARARCVLHVMWNLDSPFDTLSIHSGPGQMGLAGLRNGIHSASHPQRSTECSSGANRKTHVGTRGGVDMSDTSRKKADGITSFVAASHGRRCCLFLFLTQSDHAQGEPPHAWQTTKQLMVCMNRVSDRKLTVVRRRVSFVCRRRRRWGNDRCHLSEVYACSRLPDFEESFVLFGWIGRAAEGGMSGTTRQAPLVRAALASGAAFAGAWTLDVGDGGARRRQLPWASSQVWTASNTPLHLPYIPPPHPLHRPRCFC